MKLTEATQKELTDALLQRDRDVNVFIDKLHKRAKQMKLTVKPDENTVENTMEDIKQEITDSKRIDLNLLGYTDSQSVAYECYSMARQLRVVGYSDSVIKSAVFEFWLNRKPSLTEF